MPELRFTTEQLIACLADSSLEEYNASLSGPYPCLSTSHTPCALPPITADQIDELQKYHFLPRSPRRGKGQARGREKTYWSEQQMTLVRALHLLSFFRDAYCMPPQTFFALRGSLPVSRWLYAGDAAGVSLEQVKHLMAAWAQRFRQHILSLPIVAFDARQISTLLRNPSLYDIRNTQNALKRKLASTSPAASSQQQEYEEYQEILAPFFDADPALQRSPGSEGISLHDASWALAITPTLLEKLSKKHIPSSQWKSPISDTDWWKARYRILCALHTQHSSTPPSVHVHENALVHTFQYPAPTLTSCLPLASWIDACFHLAIALAGIFGPGEVTPISTVHGEEEWHPTLHKVVLQVHPLSDHPAVLQAEEICTFNLPPGSILGIEPRHSGNGQPSPCDRNRMNWQNARK